MPTPRRPTPRGPHLVALDQPQGGQVDNHSVRPVPCPVLLYHHTRQAARITELPERVGQRVAVACVRLAGASPADRQVALCACGERVGGGGGGQGGAFGSLVDGHGAAPQNPKSGTPSDAAIVRKHSLPHFQQVAFAMA
jgi:hypothetical protein